MKYTKITSRAVLTPLLAVVLWLGVFPLQTALASSTESQVFFSQSSSYSNSIVAGAEFLPGEVLAPADTLEQAYSIAKAYGLELKSYAYGIAVLITPSPQEAIAQSIAMLNPKERPDDLPLPQLTFNRLYHTCDAKYGYDKQMMYKAGDFGKSAYKHSLLIDTAPFSSSLPDRYSKTGIMPPRPQLDEAADCFMQWQHAIMDNERAWDISTGENVLVAVIDTGIDINHPDFLGRISAKSYNAYTNQVGIAYVEDDYGHGVHVSGIIAGAANDEEGVSGIAPQAVIMTIKANLPYAINYIDQASWLRGVNYAVENGVKVINMSFGRDFSGGPDALEQETLANAVASGVTLVCAAGNYDPGYIAYPAAYDETIAVSAIKWDNKIDLSYSNYGAQVDIAAPGTAIYSTFIGGLYEYNSGTSMAAPCVSGAAALIISKHPEYTQKQVREALCNTARDNGEIGKDIYYGYGIINSYAALLDPQALYRVKFDFAYGNRDPYIAKVVPGSYLLETYSPRREGYAFSGWYIEGSAERFSFKEPINKDLNLYARWAEIQPGMYFVEFPDTFFCREVLTLLNNDGAQRTESSIISTTDKEILASFTDLDVTNMLIEDMTGLSYFSGITTLNCDFNKLTMLDISKNSNLELLNCSFNQLTTLDVSKNSALQQLHCYDNLLTDLSTTNNKELFSLGCSFNQLSTLDVSANTMMQYLYCSYNLLSELDIAKSAYLQYLDCAANQLSVLDISQNPLLEDLNCSFNQLSALDTSKNPKLIELFCWYNKLKALDVSNCPFLNYLDCDSNEIEKLDLSNNLLLKTLFCPENRLTTLNIANNAVLSNLFCYNNYLKMLDISNNVNLTWLDCSENYMESLDKVIGWEDLHSLALDDNFIFYPQHFGEPPTGKDITASFKDAGFLAVVREIIGKAEGPILDYDVAGIRELYLSNWDIPYTITDLSGIEHFASLTYLYCYNQGLEALDVSKNKMLRSIVCSSNRLTALNVAQNLLLEKLECDNNLLGVLDISANTKLITLYCGDDQLNSLDISNNTMLQNLSCGYNNMTVLNISGNKELWYLDCSYNDLTSLDISQNSNLIYLFCNNNKLTSLNVSDNPRLYSLYCRSNYIRTLDVANNTDLTWLECSGNYIPSIANVIGWEDLHSLVLNDTFIFYPQHLGEPPSGKDITASFKDPVFLTIVREKTAKPEGPILDYDVADIRYLYIDYWNTEPYSISDLSGIEHFVSLEGLYCNTQQLEMLDVSKNTMLQELNCSYNRLNTLDVSQNISLTWLECSGNLLTDMDVSKNTWLRSFYCRDNKLSTLNVSNNTALQYFSCANNHLNTLDICANTALWHIDCDSNYLAGLDTSQNNNLMDLYCGSNHISSLDISNNPWLYAVFCPNNYLKTLDITNNEYLAWLNCYGNYMKTIDSVNGWEDRHELVLNDNFIFYPQHEGEPPTGKDITASFKDPVFLTIVREITAKPEGPIFDYDVASISSLQIDYKNTAPYSISDLAGIENFISLEKLSCHSQQLRELDVSNNNMLQYLDCAYNQLATLDLSQNPWLYWLDCFNNQLNYLNIDLNTELISLNCSNNRFRSLDITKNIKLEYLNCYNLGLYSLDISKNTQLDTIICSSNNLSALDLSNNTNLVSLYCSENPLYSLDVSNNILLRVLSCSSNRLTTLDISQSINLENLSCEGNQLTILDVSNNTVLNYLSCFNNEFYSLYDVIGWQELGLIMYDSFYFFPQNIFVLPDTFYTEFPDPCFRREVLRILNTDGGNRSHSSIVSAADIATLATISQLNVANMDIADMTGLSYFSGLRYLWCGGNLLTILDISKNSALLYLDCSQNYFTTTDLVIGWQELGLILEESFIFDLQKETLSFLEEFPDASFRSNVLSILNLEDGGKRSDKSIITDRDKEKMNSFIALFLNSSGISNLTGLSYFSGIKMLWCDYNMLNELDVSFLTGLELLSCAYNQIRTLDVSHNLALEELSCRNNQIRTLDLSHNLALKELSCRSNQLTSLDLTNNRALRELNCPINRIRVLDLSQNSLLETLNCGNNLLTTLDVLQNVSLKNLFCDYNYMQSPDDVLGWQKLGLIMDKTFWFYPQNTEFFISVADIIEVPTQAFIGSPLLLSGTVLPANATNKYIEWSVVDAGDTGAIISGNALHTLAPGIVIIRAEIEDALAIGTAYNKDFTITVEEEVFEKYNYTVFLNPHQNSYSPGDTVLVDLMLTGDINYTQISAELAYNADVLDYAGYEGLQGWVASVNQLEQGNISVRSIPSSDAVFGETCTTPVQIVTLSFVVKEELTSKNRASELSFKSLYVGPPAGYIGAATAPGLPLIINLAYESADMTCYGIVTRKSWGAKGWYYLINGEVVYGEYRTIDIERLPIAISYNVPEEGIGLENIIVFARPNTFDTTKTWINFLYINILTYSYMYDYSFFYGVYGIAESYSSTYKALSIIGEGSYNYGTKVMVDCSSAYIYDMVEDDEIDAKDLVGCFVLAICDKYGEAVFVAKVNPDYGDTDINIEAIQTSTPKL